MSALPLDLELSDLEAARDEITDVVMTMISVGLIHPSTRDDLTPALFKLGGAVDTINRAIEAHGEAKPERTVGDG